MKKNLILTIAILLNSVFIYAQKATVTSSNLSKKSVPAFTKTYKISKDELEEVLEYYFVKEKKFKKLKGQGYTQYKGAQWSEISQEKIDIYYAVNGKKNKSTVNMMVSKGYDNFVSNTTNEQMSNAILGFLDNFETEIAKLNSQKSRDAQQKLIKDEESNLSDLEKQKEKKEKTIKEEQEDLRKIEEKIAEQKSKIEKEKNTLSQLNNQK